MEEEKVESEGKSIFLVRWFISFLEIFFCCAMGKPSKKKRNPYDRGNCFTRFFSLWIFPFLCTGFCKTLEKDDIPPVPKKFEASQVFKKFNKKYEKGKNTKRPLFLSLLRFMWLELLILEFFNLSILALSLASPFLQRVILEHLFPAKDTEEWIKWEGTGYIFVFILFCMEVVKIYFTKISEEMSNSLNLKTCLSLLAKVYDKLLRFSSKALAETNNQSFVTYTSVEIGLIMTLPSSLMTLYKQPIMVVLSIAFLYINLQWPSFLIIAVVIFLVPMYLGLSICMLFVFLNIIKRFSENTKIISGVLAGMRVIKTNVWENVFLERLMVRRRKFVYVMILYFVLMIFFMMISNISPLVMQIVIFSLTFSFEKQNFTIYKIFPSLSYIMMFSDSIVALPTVIIQTGKGLMSTIRFEKLLKRDEFDSSLFTEPPKQKLNEEEDEEDERKDNDSDDENQNNPFGSSMKEQYPIRVWDCSFMFHEKPVKSNNVGKKKFSLPCFSKKGKTKKDESTKKENEKPVESKDFLNVKKNEESKMVDKDEDHEDHEHDTHKIENNKSEKVEGNKKDEKEIPKLPEKKIGKLENINLKIKKGSLVAVIGEVGSGKSMLLKSLIGELRKTNNGHLKVNGSVCYCGQNPWVINDTIEQNILFGREKKDENFEVVLEACDLRKDLKNFDFQEYTEVGERGVTLSGGQKQRIALARGFYSDAEIFLLDDISASVDPGVANSIFEKGIHGVIKGKTVLLVTNQLSWLSRTDYIISLENGKIREEGKYEDLLNIPDGFVKYLCEKFTNIEKSRIEQKDIDKFKNNEGDSVNVGEVIIDISGENEVSSEIIGESTHDEKNRKKKEEEEEDEIEGESEEGGKMAKEKEEKRKLKKKSIMLQEEREKGQVGWSTIWFYFQTFGCCNCLSSSIATLLFLGVITIVHFLYKHILQIWLSFWTTDYLGLSDVVYLSIYACIGFTQPVFGICRFLMLIVFSLCSGVRITRKVYRRLMQTPISYWERTPLGRILNRLSGDQFQADFLIIPINGFIRTVFAIIFSLVTVGMTNWFSVIIIICIIPVYIVIQEFYRRSAREVQRIAAVSRSPIMALLRETVEGVHIIRSYGAEEHFFSRYCEKVNDYTKVNFMLISLNIWLQYILGNVSSVIILFSGLLIVASKGWSVSGISVLAGLSFSHLLSFTGQLVSLVHMVVGIEQNFNSVERLKHYAVGLEIEKPEIIKGNRPHANWAISDKFGIEFENIHMRYLKPEEETKKDEESKNEKVSCVTKLLKKNKKKDDPKDEDKKEEEKKEIKFILNGLTFEINPQEKIGIVGRSGSGKTSIFNVLFRIVEPEIGKVVIDGVDICDNFGLHDLRKVMTIIPQDAYLFKGTVRFNLDPINSEKDDDKIWEILGKCRLQKTVESYPKKLNHELDGTNLSAGEKQLFCLARSLIRKTKILCLDEATANIDLETETFIKETIDREFKDSIVFTIAHRIHTVAASDRLLVLGEGGEIEEFDTPLSLSKNKNSLFYKILSDLGEENKKKLIEIIVNRENAVI